MRYETCQGAPLAREEEESVHTLRAYRRLRRPEIYAQVEKNQSYLYKCECRLVYCNKIVPYSVCCIYQFICRTGVYCLILLWLQTMHVLFLVHTIHALSEVVQL